MLPKFNDSKGRSWTLAISIGLARKIRSETGVDFGAIGDGRIFFGLASDPYLLGQVLWLLVEPSATSRGIGVDEFLDGIDGDVLESATEALTSAIVNFTPSPLRNAVAAIVEKTRQAQEVAVETATEWAAEQMTAEAIKARTREALESGNRSQS